MPNTCPVCLEVFVSWVDYHAHTNFTHNVKPTHEQIKANTPKVIRKRVYVGPMDRKEKARIVEQGEQRLGTQYFFKGDL